MTSQDTSAPEEGSLGSLAGHRVLVLGHGVSGRAAAEALTERGAQVTVADRRAEAVGVVPPERVDLDAVDLVVTSPGWPPTAPLLLGAARRGLPVWSEVELAWRLRARAEAPWLAVTGTNGKTTTVQLLAALLNAAGRRAVAAGNVGTPLVRAVADPEVEVFAVELSSFQLHFTHSTAPRAAACLNLAPDHLDWHGSMAAYAADKARVFARTERACVYNVDDAATRTMVEDADVAEGCLAVGFTLGVPRLGELGVVQDMLVDRAFAPDRHTAGRVLAHAEDLRGFVPDGPIPPHVSADALAACALALAADVPAEALAPGLRSFAMGAHRLETVARVGEVTYVDDSKATNGHAADAALASMAPGRTVWIAGGLAKGARFEELVAARADRLRSVVLIGVDHTELAAALARHAPSVPVFEVGPGDTGTVMERAVRKAARVAQPGDTVLLAPACASMDQFVSYADRGEAFVRAVRALET